MAVLTGEQIRAARALIRWEQKRLAEASKVSLETVKRLEGIEGPVSANAATVDKLQRALESAGVVFVEPNGLGPGVRLRERGAATFGQDEASCVVYGMPRAAWENGAAQQQVSLDRIPEYICHQIENTGASHATPARAFP